MRQLLRRIKYFIWESRQILLFVAPSHMDTAMQLGDGFSWSCVTSGEDPLAAALMKLSFPLGRKFRARFSQGEQCLVVCWGEELVHFSWLSSRALQLPEIGFARLLHPQTAYVYHSYTFPPFRGRGVYAGILGMARQYAQGRGLRQLLIATESDNHAARAAITRAGFEELSRVRARRILGIWQYEPKDWFSCIKADSDGGMSHRV